MKFITSQSETWKLDRESPEPVLFVEVDLSAYQLHEQPVVTARLSGEQAKNCSLGTFISTARGFAVALQFPKANRPRDESGAIRLLTPGLAQELGLSVHWIVIGS